ncbi:AzlC family ABC transporter permease [Photobacterium sp. TLY01]|uniref:AzlC family ABC transporter permease n=1 Tax=Photobacterium sp. TLY01 TaxID=2907534 RepID=UPI001F2FD987|nr:AzlC family ABC transporter permease [Photobacterium sp. TLY01]UIP30339.1 AzlC family ABC transporter permease [Photobacterium sp. TLY01]
MHTQELKLELNAIQQGFVSLVPISLFVFVFGAAFGLAAAQEGLNDAAAVLMSALVFAGASQFAALDLWGTQVPVLPLAITVFAINARHLLIGATLYPHIRSLNPATRYGVMLVASDANWALSMRAFAQNETAKGLGLLFGGGIAIWFFWMIGTWVGFYFGNAIQNPSAFGVDMVMGCFLLTMALGGSKNNKTYVIWAAAAASSIAAYLYLPENSHVIVGALTGGITGVFLKGDNHEH